MPASHCKAPDKLFRLWTHEVQRVISDRLIDDADKTLLFQMMCDAAESKLESKMEEFLSGKATGENLQVEDLQMLFFGNYLGEYYNGNFFVYSWVESQS